MPELAPDPTQLSRLELLQLAQSLGVSDADVMTRAELRAAIDKARRPEPPRVDHYSITWVSVARRLLASVVERGLNLPDAASLIRGDTKLTSPPKPPPPVATVTLARIYGAQGHLARAIATLNEVLESDPDHEIARDLRDQLELRRLELMARAAANGADGVRAPDAEDGLVVPFSGSGGAGVGDLHPAGDAAALAGSSTAGFVAASPGEAHTGRVPDTERFPDPPAAAEPPPLLDAAPVPAAEAVATEPSSLPEPLAVAECSVVEQPSLVEPCSHDAAQAPRETLPPDVHVQPPDVGALPSAAANADANAELVAPTFDTVERSGLVGEAVTESPPAFVTTGPTMDTSFESPRADSDGALPGDSVPSRDDVDTEPPATIASDVELPAEDVELPAESATIEPPPISAPPVALTAPVAPALDEDRFRAEATTPTPTGAPLVEAEPDADRTIEPESVALPPGAVEAPSAGSDELVHAPNGVARGATSGASLANGMVAESGTEASASMPRVPGLVLIETGTPVRYVYWELADAALGAPPHWIHVVSHTPTPRGGTERHERRFPVHRRLGVLRLEGVPAQAVLRARLTDASDGRPLVVAGAVRPREAGPFEVRFSPHPSAKPDALATRAQPLLERASPVYWDG